MWKEGLSLIGTWSNYSTDEYGGGLLREKIFDARNWYYSADVIFGADHSNHWFWALVHIVIYYAY